MQRQFSSARKILEAFREGQQFLCLRDLAKASGFLRVSDRDFKDGFNYLVSKGVLKLQQSGWRSEGRRGKRHVKTVILTADIYEFKSLEFELDIEKLSALDGAVLVGLEQTSLASISLTERRKELYRECSECQNREATKPDGLCDSCRYSRTIQAILDVDEWWFDEGRK